MDLQAIGWEIPVDMQRSIIPQLSGDPLYHFAKHFRIVIQTGYNKIGYFQMLSPFRNGLQSVFNRL
jgi:hypothetical protein